MAIYKKRKGGSVLTPKGYVYEYDPDYEYWRSRMEWERQMKEDEMRRYYERQYYKEPIAWTSASTTTNYIAATPYTSAGGSAVLSAAYAADPPTSNLDWLAKEVDKICAKTRNPVPQKVLKPAFTVSAA